MRRIESKVMSNFFSVLNQHSRVSPSFFGPEDSLFDIVNGMRRSEFLFVGSPLVRSLSVIFIGWMLGLKIVYVMWDVYPVQIAKRYYGGKFKVFIQYLIEKCCSKIIDLSVVPNVDFLQFSLSKKAIALPIWPQSVSVGIEGRKFIRSDQPVEFVFLGNVNETRGLEFLLPTLKECFDFKFRVWIVGSVSMFMSDFDDIDIQILEFIDEDEVQSFLSDMDVGIISLHPELQTPGFPSKIFDYVNADLPIIFFGPDLPAYRRLVIECLGGFVLYPGRGALPLSVVLAAHEARDLDEFKRQTEFCSVAAGILLNELDEL